MPDAAALCKQRDERYAGLGVPVPLHGSMQPPRPLTLGRLQASRPGRRGPGPVAGLGGAGGAQREHQRDARVARGEAVLAVAALEGLKPLVAVEVVLVQEVDPRATARLRSLARRSQAR